MMSTVQSAADYETLQQHYKGIEEQMTKSKPRDWVLLPLMKSTFATRWLFVKRMILEKYPALKLPTIVGACTWTFYASSIAI